MTRSRARQLHQKGQQGADVVDYAVILPTYNERENLPLVIYFLVETFKRLYVSFLENVVL